MKNLRTQSNYLSIHARMRASRRSLQAIVASLLIPPGRAASLATALERTVLRSMAAQGPSEATDTATIKTSSISFEPRTAEVPRRRLHVGTAGPLIYSIA